MSFTSRLVVTGDVGGVPINSNITRTAEGNVGQSVTVAAAQSGTLSTRTNNTDGTLTLGTGHGITTGAKIDLYWATGRRYNVTVGTVATNSVPISSGSGDNLPLATTAVTAAVRTVIDADFVGDYAYAMAAQCAKRAHVDFLEGSTIRLSVDILPGESWSWLVGGTAVNPLTGYAISSITATHSDTSAAEVNIGVLYSSTGTAYVAVY